jgi:sulfopyruvate decarboxylase TPP-binding subunit
VTDNPRVGTRYNMDPYDLLEQLRSAAITHVVTVPDYIQLSLHAAIDRSGGIPQIAACSENETLGISTGLIITGHRPVVIMQNQGLLACINWLRTLAVDARIPLVILVGLFGREDENMGHPPTKSRRHLVRATATVLDAIDVAYDVFDSQADIPRLGPLIAGAFAEEKAACALIGWPTAWRQTNLDSPAREETA